MRFLSMVLLILSLFSMSFAFAQDKTTIANAKYYIQKATYYFNQKDFPKSEEYFAKVLKTKIKVSNDFNFYYGKVLAINGKYRKSKRYISRYLKKAGDDGKFIKEALFLQENVQLKLDQED